MSYWKGRRTLVTGGAGFVGSHLVEMLVADGAAVRVVDNLERGRLSNLDAVLDDVEFVQDDLRDPEACLRATAGMECVINMAAKVTGIEYNRGHHGDMYTCNVLINTNVLEAARLNDVTRFCAVSTACIYPHDALVPTPESEGDRGTPEPTNEGYGWAKRMAEKQARYYAAEYGMEIAIVRPFNAYGPRDYYDRATHAAAAESGARGRDDCQYNPASGREERRPHLMRSARDIRPLVLCVTETAAVAAVAAAGVLLARVGNRRSRGRPRCRGGRAPGGVPRGCGCILP